MRFGISAKASSPSDINTPYDPGPVENSAFNGFRNSPVGCADPVYRLLLLVSIAVRNPMPRLRLNARRDCVVPRAI